MSSNAVIDEEMGNTSTQSTPSQSISSQSIHSSLPLLPIVNPPLSAPISLAVPFYPLVPYPLCCHILYASQPSTSMLSPYNSGFTTQLTQDYLHFQRPRIRPFIPKVKANHSKSNFYISEEFIKRMVTACFQKFHSFKKDDEGLAFNYFKQSVAMCINDGQVYIIESVKGDVILIDTDLHFKDGQKMYFVAMKNEEKHIHQMEWRIYGIYNIYGIFKDFPDLTEDYLPYSSRQMQYFQDALDFEPFPVAPRIFHSINVHKLPKKYPRKGFQQKRMTISVRDFLFKCRQTFERGDYLMIPVVVVKGNQTWIEWKVPINICSDDYMCISLKYEWGIQEWTVACLDFDAGCMYYKHRLVGPHRDSVGNFSYGRYEDLKKYCTISLDFK